MAASTLQMGTNLGDYLDLNYIGNTQAIRINKKAYYKLECWGAGGGGGAGSQGTGGAGGYACGYKLFEEGTTIYVRVGNGGWFNNGNPQASKGGESTHFATMDGTIQAMGSGNKSKLLVVAGGGGGGCGDYVGGAGGGETGGDGYYWGPGSWYGITNGATQTSGYAWGVGHRETSAADGNGGGGGDGLWGGENGYANYDHNSRAGGGGSGYVGGVPTITHFDITMSPTNTQGGGSAGGPGSGSISSREGTKGKAKITFAYYCDIPIWYTPKGGSAVHLERLFFNGTEIEHCYFEGTKLY